MLDQSSLNLCLVNDGNENSMKTPEYELFILCVACFLVPRLVVSLTALVALLEVAVAGLHRGALAVVIDPVAGAPALLDAPPTRHGTMGPFRPGRPAVLGVVAR